MKTLKKYATLGLAAAALASPLEAKISNQVEVGYDKNHTQRTRLWTFAQAEDAPIKYVGMNELYNFDSYFGSNRIELGDKVKAIALVKANQDGILTHQYGIQVPLPEWTKTDFGCLRATTNGDDYTVEALAVWTLPADIALEVFNSYNGKKNYTEVELEKPLANNYSAIVRAEMVDLDNPNFVLAIGKKF